MAAWIPSAHATAISLMSPCTSPTAKMPRRLASGRSRRRTGRVGTRSGFSLSLWADLYPQVFEHKGVDGFSRACMMEVGAQWYRSYAISMSAKRAMPRHNTSVPGWPSPAQRGQMVNAPGHDHVDRQAVLQAACRLQLACFDAAAALQDAMIDFDAPAPRIPFQAFIGGGRVLHLDRGQPHPFQTLDIRWGVDLARQHRPHPHGGHVAFPRL